MKRFIADSSSTLVSTTDTVMMLYAVDPFVFLRRLVVGWESLIADTGETFPAFAVKLLALNNQQAVLRHNADGMLQIVSEDANAVDLGVVLTEVGFWKLLFGEIGWEQLSSEASVSPEISAFPRVLFPKRDVIFWSPDRY